MNKFLTIWIVASLFFAWASFEVRQPNNFYDIEGLNKDIKAHLDIDLLSIMEKTEAVYKYDTSYYMDLIQERYVVHPNKCFERAGIPRYPVNSKGIDLSEVESRDSLAQIMMVSYAENIKLDDCNPQTQDSLCLKKMQWFTAMKSIDPTEEDMYYSFFHEPLKTLMDTNYLSEMELNYMILFIHYLGTMTYTLIE